jgi:peroxiredoxin
MSRSRSLPPAWRSLLIASLLVFPSSSTQGAEHLTFRGTFEPVKVEEGRDEKKSFELHVVAVKDDAFWCLSESGPGTSAWPARYGAKADRPALRFDRGDGISSVPLPVLRFETDKPLMVGAKGSHGEALSFEVLEEGKASGVVALRIAVSNTYGPRQMLWVEKETLVIVGGEERDFVGQGRECRLAWELVERKPLDDEQEAAIAEQFGTMLKVREGLKLEDQGPVKWTKERQQAFLAAVPSKVAFAPLAAILVAANKDMTTEDSREAAIAALKKRTLGKTLEKFELTGASGEKLAAADLTDNVTVLHVWDYRDTPLEEPYGQVGYLDFLARQNKGVKVYGVMVDDRLAEKSSRGAAIASARKVKSFMNLSYPILLDDAGLVKQLGDPRTTGAKLPLWIVIGKDGKVAHYHAGFYEVSRDAGLAELSAAVEAAK